MRHGGGAARGADRRAELDARVIVKPVSRVALNLGCAYFHAGDFTRTAGRPGSSAFGYAELSLSAL